MVIAQSSVGDQAHLKVAFWSRHQRGVARLSHQLRIPAPARDIPRVDVGEVTEAWCLCGAPLDLLGRQRGAGRLKSRAVPAERTLAQVCREAGAVVRSNVRLRDMNVTVPVEDEKAIEVLASGLPMLHGAQLAVYITLRRAASSDGWPKPNAGTRTGAALIRARRDKETKYAELVAGNRCRLVVIALETGGRWSDKAIDKLAGARAWEALPVLRWSVHLAWRRR